MNVIKHPHFFVVVYALIMILCSSYISNAQEPIFEIYSVRGVDVYQADASGQFHIDHQTKRGEDISINLKGLEVVLENPLNISERGYFFPIFDGSGYILYNSEKVEKSLKLTNRVIKKKYRLLKREATFADTPSMIW